MLIISPKNSSQRSLLATAGFDLFLGFAAAVSIVFLSNTYAQGIPGAGGAGGIGYTGRAGGSGGASTITGNGLTGGTALFPAGAGGGGAGAIRGGNGGSASGAPGGTGASFLGSAAANGGNASSGNTSGGGGGGGGVVGRTVISSSFSGALRISGTNGGTGGTGGSLGSGGGGGGGGNGVIVIDSGTLINAGTVLGGAGGNGGDARFSPSSRASGGDGGNGGAGIYLGNNTTLINSGNINGGNGGAAGVGAQAGQYSGNSGSSAPGIYIPSGNTSAITNTGTVIGGTGSYGIQNAGTISIFNNGQSGLTYSGTLPSEYNIIINSSSAFGTLSATSLSGSTTLGITSSSTVSRGTYAAVLSGLTSSNIANYGSIFNTWNNFNSSYKWELVQGGSATTWDLVIAVRAANILPGSINLLSSVGGSLNPVLEGGTLRVDSASTSSNAFSLRSTGGRIDANGLRSVFAGTFSNATGETGKLTIVNSGIAGQGVVVLAATNTHTGGTEVQAGANLSIAASDALGTGALDLVGGVTVPATLTTTETMVISNPITVSGDPTFNIASGTTTTISAPITDGVSSGDVVVSGGGTLNLTAVNTYTGPTTVDAGSTLALSGAGSIVASSLVTNNGTFNIVAKSSNVSVANYVQSATGTLAMNVSPGGSTQQLNVTGTASLAGALALTAGAGSYTSGKYILLTANGVTGTFGSFSSNLSSYTTLGYGLTYDANSVYLIFTPNKTDTQQSLVNTASNLQNIYTLQNSVLANSFSYDCNEFGANGICISAGGRNTAVSAANGLNNTSGLLIGAYRPHQHYRIGAYVDQNLSMNNAVSTVNLGNNTPLIGLFGAWNQNVDGTGTEVKVSVAYGQKNTAVNRQVVGTSEAGSGSSQLNSQGAQVTAKYGFGVVENVIVAPYIGIRYTQNNMGGYTEGTSATVTAPLTYSALNTNATTALAGLGASYKFVPQAGVFGSAGVETDTNTANGTYSATGLSGLTPINFNANPVKTRPTAMLGAYYDVAKNQRLGVTGIYRQEPFQAAATTTVMATYTIGM